MNVIAELIGISNDIGGLRLGANIPSFSMTRTAELKATVTISPDGEVDVKVVASAPWMSKLVSSIKNSVQKTFDIGQGDAICGVAYIGEFSQQNAWSDDAYIAVKSDNKRLAAGMIGAVKRNVPVGGGGVVGTYGYKGSGAVESAAGGTEYSYHYSSWGIGD